MFVHAWLCLKLGQVLVDNICMFSLTCRPTASRPQAAQDPGTTTSLVAGISPVPSSSHLFHTTSRTQPLTNADYMAVPLADSDVEMLNPGVESEPEEAVDNRRGVISLAPPAPQRRPPNEEPYGQSLPRL